MTPRPSRRQLVAALTGALVAVGSGVIPAPPVAAAPTRLAPDGDGQGVATGLGPLDTVATLEAFADTMVPGEKRHALDRAIAGAAPGPGAVQAGAVALLQLPELGVELLLPELAALLNTEATAWALRQGPRAAADPTPVRRTGLRRPDPSRGHAAEQRRAGPEGLRSAGAVQRGGLRHGRPTPHRRGAGEAPPRTDVAALSRARRGRILALPDVLVRQAARAGASAHHRRRPAPHEHHGTYRRPRHRQRLRRRDPRLPPGGGRRPGRRARARTATCGPRTSRTISASAATPGSSTSCRATASRSWRETASAAPASSTSPLPCARPASSSSAGAVSAAACGRSLTRVGARPLVRPGRGDPAGGTAAVGRRAVPRRPVRRGVRARGPHRATRCRSPSTWNAAPTATGC